MRRPRQDAEGRGIGDYDHVASAIATAPETGKALRPDKSFNNIVSVQVTPLRSAPMASAAISACREPRHARRKTRNAQSEFRDALGDVGGGFLLRSGPDVRAAEAKSLFGIFSLGEARRRSSPVQAWKNVAVAGKTAHGANAAWPRHDAPYRTNLLLMKRKNTC